MFSFKSIRINPSLAYDTQENKDRVLEILDDNPFVKKTIFGVFGELADGNTILEMDSVNLTGEESKTSVYLQVVIEGNLVHKVGWYGNKQEEIFNGLRDWFNEVEGLELAVLITPLPAPPKCGFVARLDTG
jgi:hypothetical protein